MISHTKVTAVSKTAIMPVSQSIPLYSSQPAAGFPAPGDDAVEAALDLNELMVDRPEATFFVRVAGDSMVEAGIFDGDILVIDRSIEATAGKIVVAAVYGELVVKRLASTTKGLALVSANSNYQPILISEKDDVYIWGVATGSVRVF